MSMKRTIIAIAAAGSLTVLGAGIAQANDMKAPPKAPKKVEKEEKKQEKRKPARPPMQKKVTVKHQQQQDCTYKALIPVNVALLNLDSDAGSFDCAQSSRVG